MGNNGYDINNIDAASLTDSSIFLERGAGIASMTSTPWVVLASATDRGLGLNSAEVSGTAKVTCCFPIYWLLKLVTVINKQIWKC